MTRQENSQGSDEKPTGIIPRVAKQELHTRFIQSNPSLDTVMLPVTHARRYLRQGVTAEALTTADVITTSTIPDEDLSGFNWEEERDIVQSFNPRYHIPTDYPIYADMEPENREGNLQKLMDGTEWMTAQLANDRPEIIPLVKGYTPNERGICYDTFASRDFDYISFYGSQYFGGANGRSINKLEKDVRTIISEYSPSGLLLIGPQTKNALSRFPPEVVAAAGNRWIKETGLRDTTIDQVKTRFGEWASELEVELSAGMSTLGSFQDQEVTA
ncbi:MAG: hypothetical protein U5K70_05865 [Halodesulfurarchaeum sp.]|nr:hypothetical protein [Halodesulfurarchaeum sp.]